MKALKKLFFLLLIFPLNGCYLWHLSYNQLKILGSGVPLEEAGSEYDLPPQDLEKLELVLEIKEYAKKKLGMEFPDHVYSEYVQLENPYITSVLVVAYEYELRNYYWSFPITGKVPYKGFYKRELAEEEAKKFPEDEYDTHIGGTSAYSTLGWLSDPITSAMLYYNKGSFTTLLFHELTHIDLWFPGHGSFNERFAEFVGRTAALLFFKSKEGEDSKTALHLEKKWEDESLYSEFMSEEIDALDKWYKDNKGNITPKKKEKRLKDIQVRLEEELLPKLHFPQDHSYLLKIKLNNAIMIQNRTYNYDPKDFEVLYDHLGQDLKKLIDYCASFKYRPDPEKALKATAELILKGKLEI